MWQKNMCNYCTLLRRSAYCRRHFPEKVFLTSSIFGFKCRWILFSMVELTINSENASRRAAITWNNPYMHYQGLMSWNKCIPFQWVDSQFQAPTKIPLPHPSIRRPELPLATENVGGDGALVVININYLISGIGNGQSNYVIPKYNYTSISKTFVSKVMCFLFFLNKNQINYYSVPSGPLYQHVT